MVSERPTLELVKEHYRDAKFVYTLCESLVDVTIKEAGEIFEEGNFFWITIAGESFILWSKDKGFAQITLYRSVKISYTDILIAILGTLLVFASFVNKVDVVRGISIGLLLASFLSLSMPNRSFSFKRFK